MKEASLARLCQAEHTQRRVSISIHSSLRLWQDQVAALAEAAALLLRGSRHLQEPESMTHTRTFTKSKVVLWLHSIYEHRDMATTKYKVLACQSQAEHSSRSTQSTCFNKTARHRWLEDDSACLVMLQLGIQIAMFAHADAPLSWKSLHCWCGRTIDSCRARCRSSSSSGTTAAFLALAPGEIDWVTDAVSCCSKLILRETHRRLSCRMQQLCSTPFLGARWCNPYFYDLPSNGQGIYNLRSVSSPAGFHAGSEDRPAYQRLWHQGVTTYRH